MPLTDFFRINLPYGIAKNSDGAWMAFNREYLPIGFNGGEDFDLESKSEYPIHTNYKNITNELLLRLADLDNDTGAIKRNDNGDIIKVFFYNDQTNPVNQSNHNNEYWHTYFAKLKILATLIR